MSQNSEFFSADEDIAHPLLSFPQSDSLHRGGIPVLLAEQEREKTTSISRRFDAHIMRQQTHGVMLRLHTRESSVWSKLMSESSDADSSMVVNL